jgi:cytidylate kinase
LPSGSTTMASKLRLAKLSAFLISTGKLFHNSAPL